MTRQGLGKTLRILPPPAAAALMLASSERASAGDHLTSTIASATPILLALGANLPYLHHEQTIEASAGKVAHPIPPAPSIAWARHRAQIMIASRTRPRRSARLLSDFSRLGTSRQWREQIHSAASGKRAVVRRQNGTTHFARALGVTQR